MSDEIDYKKEFIALRENYRGLLNDSIGEYEAYNPCFNRRTSGQYFRDELETLQRIYKIED